MIWYIIFGWSVKGGCRPPNKFNNGNNGVFTKNDAKLNLRMKHLFKRKTQKACHAPPAMIMEMENGWKWFLPIDWVLEKKGRIAATSATSPSILDISMQTSCWNKTYTFAKGKKHVWSWSFRRIPASPLATSPTVWRQRKVAWKRTGPSWKDAASPCYSPEHWLVNQTQVGIVEVNIWKSSPSQSLSISYGDTHL